MTPADRLRGSRAGRRPWTPAEVGLLLLLAYLVLLIGLAGTRLGADGRPVAAAVDRSTTGPRARLVAATGPAGAPAPAAPVATAPAPRTTAPGTAAPGTAAPGAAAPGAAAPGTGSAGAGAEAEGRAAGAASCVGPGTVPRSYAGEPGVEAPLAFGPPVERDGVRTVEAVNGTLIQRLCGGPPDPGRPYRPPDRRLFVALDAVINGRDPNRALSRAQWAAGVDAFVTRDARWTRARIVTRDSPAGTRTYAMRTRPGADPLVEATRLAVPTRSRYLVLPVRRADGGETVLTLRLACGFQPTFLP